MCMDICVVLGSKSDLPVAEKCKTVLDMFDVSYEIRVASAHRAPKYLEGIIESAEQSGCKVFIGMAGVAAALPGVIASMTAMPVIGVPVGGRVPLDSLLSIVQMPRECLSLQSESTEAITPVHWLYRFSLQLMRDSPPHTPTIVRP